MTAKDLLRIQRNEIKKYGGVIPPNSFFERARKAVERNLKNGTTSN